MIKLNQMQIVDSYNYNDLMFRVIIREYFVPFQGSEPLSETTQLNDFNHTRDTRSVEPVRYSDKFQGKPPSGRHSNMKDNLPKNSKLELLPPRLQKKYLIDNGYSLPINNPGTSTEDTWNGTTITFQVNIN